MDYAMPRADDLPSCKLGFSSWRHNYAAKGSDELPRCRQSTVRATKPTVLAR
jgi:hypothetical protein